MTPAAWLLLSTLALLAPAKPSDDPTVRAQASLRRVAQLSAEQQRTWLADVEARLAWANKLTLKPEEAERERARVAALLRQKTVPWPTLVELVRQLDQREKAAISRLVRQYRAQVYDSFAKQRETLVERQEAWYRVWSKWESGGSLPEQQGHLIAWLEKAILTSTPPAIKPLPPDPSFDGRPDVAPQVAAKPAVKPPAMVEPKPSGPLPLDASQTAAKPSAPTSPRPGVDLSPIRVQVAEPKSVVPGHQPQPAGVGLARPKELALGRALTVPPRAALPARNQTATAKVEPDSKTGMTMVRRPSNPLLGAEMPAVAAGTPVDPVRSTTHDVEASKTRDPRARAGELPKKPSYEIAGSETEQPLTAPAMPSKPHGAVVAAAATVPDPAAPKRRPGGTDLALLLPKSAILVPGQEPEKRVEPEGPLVPSPGREGPSTSSETPRENHVTVNTAELAARIAGNNLALRTMEAELEEKREWNSDTIEGLLNRLDILALRQKDLAMFRDLLTADEQNRMERIELPKQAIAQLTAHIAEARSRLASGSAAGDDAPGEGELKRLTELAERLAALAAEK